MPVKIDEEIELCFSTSLQNTGFMALALIALEKQSKTRKGILKSRSIIFIDDGMTVILQGACLSQTL